MNVRLYSYGQGIPLVLFHGWGFSSEIWRSLLPKFENRYQIILVDLPGFGATNPMAWDDFKQSLLENLPSTFALLGWSLGGLYASRLAIEAPHRVSHLINLSSSPRFIADELWPAVTKEVFLAFYQKLNRDPEQTLIDFMSLQVGKNNNCDLPSIMPQKQGLDFGLKCLMEWDLRESIKNLEMPVIFMFGRLDPITPLTIMYEMQINYPHFKYSVFKKAAHMAFLSHPELFIKELEAFLI